MEENNCVIFAFDCDPADLTDSSIASTNSACNTDINSGDPDDPYPELNRVEIVEEKINQDKNDFGYNVKLAGQSNPLTP